MVLNIKKQKFQPRYKFVRDEKSFNLENYLKDFSQLPLSTVYSFDDPDDQVETLNKLITDCLSRHAPIKRTKFTRPPAPWMKRLDIVNLQKKRNELRTTAHRTQTESDWELFRNTRNELKYKIKSAKRTFYKKALASKNSKTIWRTIYRILKPNPERCTASPTSLNNYYSSLAANLTGFTSNSESNVPSNTNESRDTFTLKPTTYDAVKKEINNLKNDCSTGFDTIPVKYLKPASEYIASPITNIINNCITTNSFPKMWKIARISPIPKIKAPTKPSDYRPISVLPVISKVFERIILNQVKQFIDKHEVYQSTQSGYRKGHSCITVLLKLRDDIQCALNSSEVAIALFADYSKAFDTIRYDILLKKLNELGFSSSFIHLINSYLTDRYQFVQIEDKKSALAQVTCGVPQGSILGPILFNLYVTDISTLTSSTCLQFADDTTLYKRCKVKDIPDCANIIQNDVEHLKAWSEVNSLVFNGTKTKTMIFSTKQMSRYHHLDNADTYSVVFNGNEAKNKIEKKDSMKILGMKVDQHLTWEEHVANVIKSSYDTLR